MDKLAASIKVCGSDGLLTTLTDLKKEKCPTKQGYVIERK